MSIPQVSVIIPTCNRAGLLPTAIGSVLAQSYSNFEVVVVDDASDDPVDNIVNAFGDGRIRCIQHERRRGAAAARNTGIRNSDGEFIAFLDDDDEWRRDKLARQLSVLSHSDSAIGGVYTGYEVIERDTGRILSRMLPEHRGNLSSELLGGNCVGPSSSMLLRRTCFDSVGMFDESLSAFQEYDLWIRLSSDYQFDYVSECLFNYNVHSKRIWTNPDAIHKALGLLLTKYGHFQRFRKTCSVRYLWVAARFCEIGNGRKAREALRRAISLNPFNAKHYVYFFLSVLNQGTYQWLQDSKAKILGLDGISGNAG
jgi:glycosyltransferase involved in cell wall biosynthesis